MSMVETIIKLEKAVIRQQKNAVLKDVNLEIGQGEFVYLIGRVGSGKTSLLKTLYAELPLEYGKGEVAGFALNKIKKSNVAMLRRKCGIVFQDFKLLTDRSVRDNLEFVLKATGWRDKKAIRERISEVLEKVGLPDKQEKFPHQLSGGEQQRVVLARALLNAPPIILADEPTGNIDPETSFRLLELLKDICDGGKTILIATHQYELIKHFPGRVFRCEDGAVKEDFSFLPQEEAAVSTSGEELESPEGEPSSETLEPNSAAEVPPMASLEREEASHAPTLETPSEEKPVPEPSEEKSADETLAETAQASSPDDNENNKEKQKEKKDDKSPDDLLEFELI